MPVFLPVVLCCDTHRIETGKGNNHGLKEILRGHGTVLMDIFEIDPKIKADTLHVGHLPHCDLLLMNDDRWPWLVLVPRIGNAVEWHDVSASQRHGIDNEVSQVAKMLKSVTACEKINIASIGNIVRQLHIHVIARNTGDPNWPGPVWGYGVCQPIQPDKAEETLKTFRAALEEELE